MSLKSFIFTLLVLFLLTGVASASLIAPTTNSKGYNLWGTWWDMKGENGLRNGTLGGVGNNVTFLDGSGITFLPLSGTTSDLDMNGKNITNVLTINSTQVNVTTFNATNMAGNGSGIDSLNASNLTGSVSAVNGSALFGLNMSNATTCRGNVTCTYNANGSVSLDAVSNLTAIFNRVLNSSTVTAGVYPNGSVELTATSFMANSSSTHAALNISTDMTTYLKTGSEISVDSASNVSFLDLPTYGSIQNLTYDVGVANITDFSVSFEFLSNMAGGRFGIVTLSDLNDLSTENMIKQNSIGIKLLNSIQVYTSIDGVSSAVVLLTPGANTRYYINITRVGYYGRVVIYSDSERTNTLASSTFVVSTVPFRYITLLNNNWNHAATTSGYISNLSSFSIDNVNSGVNGYRDDKQFNTQYSNTNTSPLMVIVTAAFTTTATNGIAKASCQQNAINLSGTVGIAAGLTSENVMSQLTCIIPPNSSYRINTTTTNGNINLLDWREYNI